MNSLWWVLKIRLSRIQISHIWFSWLLRVSFRFLILRLDWPLFAFVVRSCCVWLHTVHTDTDTEFIYGRVVPAGFVACFSLCFHFIAAAVAAGFVVSRILFFFPITIHDKWQKCNVIVSCVRFSSCVYCSHWSFFFFF